MRNAVLLDGKLVVTMDNAGGIGEKKEDIVSVPDELTAYYAARVALLEQWAADAEPMMVMIHNFSGEPSWAKYVRGVTELLVEAGLEELPVSGSTETNITLHQSAVSVTMIGKKPLLKNRKRGQWFTYGSPLVGEEILRNPEEIASIERIQKALDSQFVNRIWPIGSKGLLHEVRQMLGDEQLQVESVLDLRKSAGPSTIVLVEIPLDRIEEAQLFFGAPLRNLTYE